MGTLGRRLCKHFTGLALCKWPVKDEALEATKRHWSSLVIETIAVATSLREFQKGTDVSNIYSNIGIEVTPGPFQEHGSENCNEIR